MSDAAARALVSEADAVPLRVLYVGDLTPGSTCAQRRQAFIELGCQVTAVDLASQTHRQHDRRLWERVRRKLRGPRDWVGANGQILRHLQTQLFEVLWLDRSLTIDAATVAAVRAIQPRCRILGYSPDDMHARHNQSPQFRAHVSAYDVYFTTKSYGVQELLVLGAQSAAFSANAYDPHTHRPLAVSPSDRAHYGGPLGFIGTWEAPRGRSLHHLAEAGVAVRIWGNGWERQRPRHPHLRIEGRALYGNQYALAINAFDINLCFLRKINRDLQTQRSVEIPACGGFMLAERTEEHGALFEEGREAEYFSSDAELLEKVHYYLEHPEKRREIAAAGRARCLRDGYSYAERLAEMLDSAGVPWRPASSARTRSA